MIEQLRDFPEGILAFACRGHVTRQEYAEVLIPAVERALQQREKVRLFYEIGPDFEGIDPGAVWADVKVGMGHLGRWERIAVVTDVAWIENTMKVFSFVILADMRIFPVSDAASAREWIVADA
jgi:SpoIIAA-like